MIELLLEYILLIVVLIIILVYQLTHKNFLVILLLIGLMTFFADFAKLNLKIGSIPIYVTEGVILATIVTLLLQGLVQGKLSYIKVPLQSYFFLLYIILVVSLLRGLASYEDKIYVLRQSAIFYYSIFYFFVPILFNSLRKIENLLKILFVVYLVLPLFGFVHIVPFYVGFFAYFYYFIFIIFELFYILLLRNSKLKALFFIAIAGQLAIFLLAQARAAWLGAIALSIFVGYLLLNKYLPINFFRNIIRNVSLVAFIIFLAIFVLRPNLIGQLYNEVLSIFLVEVETEQSQVSVRNVKWRLYVWKDIINETLEKPILGWGFGKKFVPPTIKALGWGGSWREEDKGWQDPHNSFLSIFHRTGIVGLTIFLLIIIKFINRYLKFVKIVQDPKIKMLILAALVSIIYVLGVSFFMVVLEGPYLGISLWFLMGLVVALECVYKKETASQLIK